MQAKFKYGSPIMIDYTPSGAVAAGEVIVVGSKVYIAHNNIAAGEKSAVASGGGVYEVAGDAAILAGKQVFWVDSTNKVTETQSTNKFFGFVTPDTSTILADTNVGLVEHVASPTFVDT